MADLMPRTDAELERDELTVRERQAREEVAHARERLHAQLMQAPVAVSIVSGPRFVYELANPLYREMIGRTEVVGQSFYDVFPELAADAPVFAMLQGVQTTGEPFTAEEFHVRLDRGGKGVLEDAYFKFTCQPVRDGAGKVQEIMTVAVEVTAQVEGRRQIEALLGDLQRADQRKDEFLATLAHELRNPLSALAGALSLLELAEGDPSSSARHRDTARRQLRHLVRLVDDLLDVARITSGKVELRKKVIDLAVVIQNAVTASRAVVEDHRHELSVTLASGAFRLEADATRIEQVIVNLLTNAAKYTEPGGSIAVRLRRETTPDGGAQAVLSVRDSGRGIPPELLERVFDPFLQVSPTLDRATGGLGLGLTLVRRLVDLHGGTVSAASAGSGRGSDLTVRLPLPAEDPGPVEAHHAPPDKPELPRRRRVLLVEDSADVRETLQEIIEHLGHDVEVAKDGLEAVDKICSLLPEVTLIDIGLPRLDGYEVVRRIRSQPGCEHLYLIALTGYGGAEVAAKAEAAGFDLHLVKPVQMDALSAVIERAWDPDS